METPHHNVLSVSPIGIVRSKMLSKFDAPHQPDQDGEGEACIELLPHQEFEKALEDLLGFDYIWLLFWFHRNSSWKPKVRPPRGDCGKKGVFATRSPHRPNPIGLTAVKLLDIQGRTLRIGNCDLVDGTPILDIKPYLPAVDAFPDARIGWLQEIEDEFSLPPTYKVEMSELASEQLEWLKGEGINFIDKAVTLLERDPTPHRTRRIRKYGKADFRMGCAEWRIVFSRNGETITVKYFQPGYPIDQLKDPGVRMIRNREQQLSFAEKWPVSWQAEG